MTWEELVLRSQSINGCSFGFFTLKPKPALADVKYIEFNRCVLRRYEGTKIFRHAPQDEFCDVITGSIRFLKNGMITLNGNRNIIAKYRTPDQMFAVLQAVSTVNKRD